MSSDTTTLKLDAVDVDVLIEALDEWREQTDEHPQTSTKWAASQQLSMRMHDARRRLARSAQS